jgi:hypothetical protein
LPQQLPQSPGQLEHVSVPLHVPSPHTAPHDPHPRLVTSLTHRPSHEKLQQYMSLGQTHASTLSSSHPGLPCVEQHDPLHEPHWSASAAQIESH